MKGNRSLFIVVGIVAVLIVGWWFFWRGGSSHAVSLMDRFDAADKRPKEPAERHHTNDRAPSRSDNCHPGSVNFALGEKLHPDTEVMREQPIS